MMFAEQAGCFRFCNGSYYPGVVSDASTYGTHRVGAKHAVLSRTTGGWAQGFLLLAAAPAYAQIASPGKVWLLDSACSLKGDFHDI